MKKEYFVRYVYVLEGNSFGDERGCVITAGNAKEAIAIIKKNHLPRTSHFDIIDMRKLD